MLVPSDVLWGDADASKQPPVVSKHTQRTQQDNQNGKESRHEHMNMAETQPVDDNVHPNLNRVIHDPSEVLCSS